MDPLWLRVDDVVSSDGSKELGQLGFPRDWPEVYQSPELRLLLGKRGKCPATRVAVVETHAAFDEPLLPWQGRVNARRVRDRLGLLVLEGYAIFERLEKGGFVAVKYAWNVLEGRWVDYSPWACGWQRILLAQAELGGNEVPLSRADWQLALELQRIHGQTVEKELEELQMELSEALDGPREISIGSLVAKGELGTAVRRVGTAWEVRWADDSLGSAEERDLELVDLGRPDLTTVGTEIAGSLARPYGTLEYSLWPLVFSGFVRVRLPGPLLKRLDAQCDRLLEERRAPSHALFLQGEMKRGEQLTIQEPDPEFEEILLSCAATLGEALLGEEDSKRYVLDSVWTVHQMEGDYNPVHFHTNARCAFGFSSFLHLQLPSSCRGTDGSTSFIWKTDSPAAGGLECPGLHEVEMKEGCLHVFPQWVQHCVWPFRGSEERRTIAANIARV